MLPVPPAGLALGGATTAAAAPLSPARQWVEANRNSLPRDYTAFAAHDLRHRKAIYAASSTSTRSRLWVEHLRDYRGAHPDLTAAGRAVVDRAIQAARDESLLADRPTEARTDPRLDALAEDAVAAFGMQEARALLATLGPVPPARQGQAAECDCNIFDNIFCWDCQGCISCPCSLCSDCTESGCGPLWTVKCNGVCQ